MAEETPDFSECRTETPCSRCRAISIPVVSRSPGPARYRDVPVPREADREIGGRTVQGPLPRQDKVKPGSGRETGLGHAGSGLFPPVTATVVSLRGTEAGWRNRSAFRPACPPYPHRANRAVWHRVAGSTGAAMPHGGLRNALPLPGGRIPGVAGVPALRLERVFRSIPAPRRLGIPPAPGMLVRNPG
jgi:hypothetical protein